jgi:hypothetical protein
MTYASIYHSLLSFYPFTSIFPHFIISKFVVFSFIFNFICVCAKKVVTLRTFLLSVIVKTKIECHYNVES